MRKRYRIVSTPRFITFLVLCVLFIIYITSSVTGSYDAEGLTEETYACVFVESGDTLWDIASQYCDDDTDVRDMVRIIRDVNSLTGSNIRSGQVLLVPEML